MAIDPDIAAALEVGFRHERALTPADRKAGSHFTPAEVAIDIVDSALDAWGGGFPVICDPSCGGGVFLVVAAEALYRRGASPEQIVDSHLIGVDVSPAAAEATRTAVATWARSRGVPAPHVQAVETRDALDGRPWIHPGGHRPDIVVGNPPFRSQLARRTARDAEERRRLSDVFGDVAKGYVDLAALFAVAAVGSVPESGVVSLVLPRSMCAARDAGPARAAIADAAEMVGIWGPGRRIFDAAVDVIVPLFRRGASSGRDIDVRLGAGRGLVGRVPVAELDVARSWSPLWATLQGCPELDLVVGERPRVADVATVSAGFRDHYYGVVGHLSETPTGSDPRRLVTTAMIDAGVNRWGRMTVRVARRDWTTPWVDAAAVSAETPSLSAWLSAAAEPKVLVATQTRVVEAVADPDGDVVALTPIISVHPAAHPEGAGDEDGIGVQAMAAALCAPPAALWALRMFGGGAMSEGSLKLAARQVARVPLPQDVTEWNAATACMADGMDPARFAAHGTRSWGIDRSDIVDWWIERIGIARD